MQPITPVNLITTAELASYAPELSPYTNNMSAQTLSGIIAQATRNVLNICHVKGFDRRQYVDEGQAWISSEGELVITAEAFPITSPADIISVSLVKGGFTAALTLQDQNGSFLFQIPDPGWRFEFPNSYFYLTGTYLAGGSSQLLTLKGAHVKYVMTYNGGFTTIPDDLKNACICLIRSIIKRNYNPFGAISWRQGQRSESYGGVDEFRIEAEDILYGGGYVRVAQY